MTIEKIKNNIDSKKENNVKVIYNGSRNKKEEYEGIIKEVKKYLPKEEIKFLETQMMEDYQQEEKNLEPIVKVKPKPEKIYVTEKPFFKSSYERYDWLMKYGCTNSDDRVWLQEYQKSDEYEMIYGAC